VDDAIERYRRASEEGDIAAMMALLEPDAELVSPISGRMVFRGEADLRVLMTAVYGSLRELRWHDEAGDERVRLLRGEARIGPFRLGDAMVFELSERGRIQRIRPHFRPWLGLTAFALVVGPKVGRHPGAVLRALRRPAGSAS
jgi:hypothetical protein